jgi:hypothetical protein
MMNKKQQKRDYTSPMVGNEIVKSRRLKNVCRGIAVVSAAANLLNKVDQVPVVMVKKP